MESALFADHAQVIGGTLGEGGWVAIGLALILGPLCCLLDVGIGRLETRVARLAQVCLRVAAAPAQLTLAAQRIVPAGLSPLGFDLAQRPPPHPAR